MIRLVLCSLFQKLTLVTVSVQLLSSGFEVIDGS